MEFGLKGHWEVVHNLNYKFFSQPDITNQQMEDFVEALVSDGDMEAEQGERFKRRNLGMGPGLLGTALFRGLRSWLEEEKRENQVQRKGWLLRLVFLFFTIIGAGFSSTGKTIGEELKRK